MGALAFARTTWRDLAARGAELRVVVAGLTTPRVEIAAPREVAVDLRAELAWRTEAMRAQARDLRRPVGAPLRALPELVLPKLPPVTWTGWRDQYGRRTRVTLTAQRPDAGLCDSCGDELPGETGDCALCNAARVAALRAEGVLAPPADLALPPRPTETEWRAELATGLTRRAPVFAPAPTWVCSTCKRTLTGNPDPMLECGPCELRRTSVMSLENLGVRRA